MQNGKANLKTIWQAVTKLNILLSYGTGIPLPGIYPHELKIFVKILSPYKNLHMDIYSSFISRDEETNHRRVLGQWNYSVFSENTIIPHNMLLCVCMHAKALQSCPTLHDPMDYSPPGSSVHGILQARTLEWVAMPSSRGSSDPRIKPRSQVSCIGRWVLYY